jgi:hypothetical protein
LPGIRDAIPQDVPTKQFTGVLVAQEPAQRPVGIGDLPVDLDENPDVRMIENAGKLRVHRLHGVGLNLAFLVDGHERQATHCLPGGSPMTPSQTIPNLRHGAAAPFPGVRRPCQEMVNKR